MKMPFKVAQLDQIAHGANLAGHEWSMQLKGWMQTGGLALLAGATAYFVLGIPLAWLRRHGLMTDWLRPLLQWVPAGAVTWFALKRISAQYTEKAKKAAEDEFVEGARLIPQEELADAVRNTPRGAGPYVFAGVPIPAGRHRLNFLATGSTGSGKTQAVYPLMQQVDDRGISSITYDRKPEFVGMRFRPGSSVILNPMDARSPQWDLFGEVANTYHYKMYADALIPEEKAGSPFWYLGSRIIFADILAMLKTQGATSVRELYEACCQWSHEDLFAALANYPMSTKFLDPEKKSSKELHSSLMSLGGDNHSVLWNDNHDGRW